MKKILSIFLTFAMVMAMLPTMVLATEVEGMHIYGDTGVETSSSSEYVTINFNIENASAFQGFTLSVGIPTGFTIVDMSLGEVASVATEWGGTSAIYSATLVTTSAGAITALATDSADHTVVDGVLLSVIYKIDTSTVVNGEYEITIGKTSDTGKNISDSNGDAVDCTFTAGSIVVTNGVEPTGTTGTVTQPYTITTTLDEEAYRSGQTITATVSASSDTATNIGGFQMEVSYDNTKVELGEISADTAFSAMEQNNDTVIFAPTSANAAVSVDGEVTLFTVTYTVKENVSGTDVEFSVADVGMMEYGYDGNDASHTIVPDTATIIDTVDITFGTCTNGSINTTTAITVDSGTLLSEITMPSTTPDTSYVHSGWAVSGSTDTILANSYAFTADTELVAVFVPDSFAISVANDDDDNATVTYQSGVADSKATYNTDVTFTVAATGNYILSDVAYSVENGTSATLNAVNGVYTIPGANITGAVTITVSTVEYFEINFAADTGATLSDTTLYAKSGNSGLYASVADLEAGTTTSVPTPTADTGYRLGTSDSTTAIWSDGANNRTTAWFDTATFSADTKYTVNTVKTYDITFAAGNNGSVSDTATVTYDTGATVSIPTATGNAGYVFSNWTNDLDSTTTSTDLSGLSATQDITYTANFTEGTYTVSFSTVGDLAYTDKTGLTDSKATYNGDNVTFQIFATTVQIDHVYYTVGDATAVEIFADNGVYTIPSSAITADTSVTVSSTDIYTVTFTSGDNGFVGGTTTFSVVNGSTASDISAVTVTPDTGYTFDGWYIDSIKYATPATETVTDNVTYTAKFTQTQYTFTATSGDVTYVSGYDSDYATYDTDVTFTISSTDSIITGVKLGETDLVAVGGVYTIPGSIISGDATALTLTVTTLSATITFIDLEEAYMAKADEAENRQMMLLDAGDSNTATYYLADGSELYWSSAYEAYVAIVADSETVQTLSTGIASTDSATTNVIDYSGDVNGDGSVDVIDAIIINDILHGTRLTTTSDAYLFRADVNGSKTISAADITLIKNTVLDITED